MQSDNAFLAELIDRCLRSHIPIQITAEGLEGLLHALFFTSMHEDDFGPGQLTGAMETLLELVAAYCLGEVTLQFARLTQETRHAPAH